ncbi:MAG: histidine phosphatase family protein [Ktedonobacteraceae bacterium]|nr:histidine phosphatase family protein [Ktedonobacteraceae bacterium]
MTNHIECKLTLVLMAGLPGTGKTTLAAELGRRLQWLVVDKDMLKLSLLQSGMEYDLERKGNEMPKVWFIRHGESEANAGLPTLFPMKTALTSNGIKQAEYIAQSFPRPPSLIITSKYIRAWQTAQPTVKRYPQARLVHPDDWPVHEFTYLSPSRVARTTLQERKHLVDAY